MCRFVLTAMFGRDVTVHKCMGHPLLIHLFQTRCAISSAICAANPPCVRFPPYCASPPIRACRRTTAVLLHIVRCPPYVRAGAPYSCVTPYWALPPTPHTCVQAYHIVVLLHIVRCPPYVRAGAPWFSPPPFTA